ncbi:MAG: nitronate monooxygenase [Rhodospirillaceae bacterium]|nr:nitronate monooxygenase [Rhodospirillaceae bacterium]
MAVLNILDNNPVCDLLGIKYPICQAGMYQVAYGELAAAVSEAGGLGVIGSAFMDPEDLRREIRLVKDRTDKPFGVDILFAEVSGEDATETGYTQQVEDHIAVTFQEGCDVLVSGLGNPGRIVPDAHARGMKVMSLVGNVRQAVAVEASGVDVVIASGHEGGGHVGRIGTISLIPKVVDSVNIPVLAAGGLADGRGLLASLAMGAQGVWMGTRFIATQEARGHDNYKNKIVEIDEDGTVVTRAHSGKPNRMIRNQFTDAWIGRETEIKPFPQQLREVGEDGSYRGRIEGDTAMGVLPAGQGAGLIHSVPPAGQVVEDIMAEARAILQGWEQA